MITMKIKELIRDLKKQPQNAELMLLEWDFKNNNDKVRPIKPVPLNNLSPNKKYYLLAASESTSYCKNEWDKMSTSKENEGNDKP